MLKILIVHFQQFAMTAKLNVCLKGNLIIYLAENKEGFTLQEHFSNYGGPSNSKDPKYLLLDEPTANLDLTYEILIMDIAKKIARNGVGVLIILHDLNLAAKYADKIMVLKDGNTLGAGLPGDVLNSELLTEAMI